MTFLNLKKISVLLIIISIAGCFRTSKNFQKDADIIRLRHLEYYGKLLMDYNKKTGKYPFQGQRKIPTYVHVANDEQIEYTKQGPPYTHEVLPFKSLVIEIESVLGNEVNEYYDPQCRPDYKPNFYIYMVADDTFYFSVHVHQPFPFAKKIGKNYYKIVVSNHPSSQNQTLSPQQLFETSEFKTESSKPLSKEGFFKRHENKYLHYTKTTT
ncbi:MAG: hypothetical protein D3924_10960 [Candidatus Electrothrix sp. AR4]|nr:hypothetical protein [Candidatus Electrothrix sp. AR4]